MTKIEHTSTPWKSNGVAIGNQTKVVCSCDWHADPDFENDGSIPETKEEAEANAAHIVHCVNQHDKLVEALAEAINRLETVPVNYTNPPLRECDMNRLRTALATAKEGVR